MGDPRRFALFAQEIERRWPDRSTRFVDVASGKGHLKAALYQRGYKRVTCWDRRKKLAKARPGQRYQLFDYRSAPRDYDVVIAMHPDEGTDHAIMYAVKHRVPFLVCPCCIKPSASTYWGDGTDYRQWNRHLADIARNGKMHVEEFTIPITGRAVVLAGTP